MPVSDANTDRTNVERGGDRPGTDYESHMRRAVKLAGMAPRRTSPNPPVGAVVVRDDEVVGEGFHCGPGTEHAEVAALRRAGTNARGATLFVTLEPCNHFGRTPPCTKAIVEAGIGRVVYGSPDPNPAVKGGGHAALESAGVITESGVLRAETDRVIRFFRRHSMSARPWVIGKVASSLDGRVVTRAGESQWITGEAARRRAHELRGMVDAVLVGSGTVRADDPALTVRLEADSDTDAHPGNPIRVVLDSHSRLSLNSRVFTTPDKAQTHCFSVSLSGDRRGRLERLGVAAHVVESDQEGRVALRPVLESLGAMDVQSLLVEGGASVLGAFHDEDLLDEVWAFISPRFIGGTDSLGSVGGNGRAHLHEAALLADVEIEPCPPDFLIRGLVRRSEGETPGSDAENEHAVVRQAL